MKESRVYRSEKRTALNSCWLAPVICLLLFIWPSVLLLWNWKKFYLLGALFTCPVWHVREHLPVTVPFLKVTSVNPTASGTLTPRWTFPFQKWDQVPIYSLWYWVDYLIWFQKMQDGRISVNYNPNQEGNEMKSEHNCFYCPFLFADCWLLYCA